MIKIKVKLKPQKEPTPFESFMGRGFATIEKMKVQQAMYNKMMFELEKYNYDQNKA